MNEWDIDKEFLEKWSDEELVDEINSFFEGKTRKEFEDATNEVIRGCMKFVGIYGGCSDKQRKVLELYITNCLWR